MGDFLELAARRESCRNFARRPVEREKLEKMIEAGRLAPSACNGQSWFFTAVTGAEAVEAVRKCAAQAGMNRFVSTCPAFILIEELRANLTSRVGGAIKGQDYTQIDIGIAAAHMALAATDLGLSTCILGWFDAKGLSEALGQARGRPRLLLCVGYAAEEGLRPKKRKGTAEVARFVE